METTKLIEQQALVDFLRYQRCKSTAADLIEQLPIQFGVRGEAPKYLNAQIIDQLIAPALAQEVKENLTIEEFVSDRYYTTA
jgi:hypothetical protein